MILGVNPSRNFSVRRWDRAPNIAQESPINQNEPENRFRVVTAAMCTQATEVPSIALKRITVAPPAIPDYICRFLFSHFLFLVGTPFTRDEYRMGFISHPP